jgi:hypothetical protein
MKPGNLGQVVGAVIKGVEPDAAAANVAATGAVMAQRWAPCRRQQAGRPESSLAPSVPTRGHSPKSRARKMENPRRI